MTSKPDPELQNGFVAFHSNRCEQLAEVVINWIRRHPLNPLEEEIILVQSNGMAEWVKMELARMGGVCAATRVELPSRFLWRTYRQVLGRESVPRDSPLDKVPMVWRLMQLLPDLIVQPDFAVVAGFLAANEPDRTLQLASKLADLFDQYQNYRADWLQAWARGEDCLMLANGAKAELPAEQRWQPQLWRAVLNTLNDHQKQSIRPELQQRVVALLESGGPLAGQVARRVVVFGMSQIPLTTMQALAALSKHCQVILAIPNPCQYYWGDIMDGRELLNAQRRRQPLRNGIELLTLPLEDMHLHAHPLLASWGRQGRDFIRQLDYFDDAQKSKQQFDLARIDYFSGEPENAATPLLLQVQTRIRDLVPLAEHERKPISSKDQSIVFRSAHSKIRELEILHDKLLDLLAQTERPTPLSPRDIIVMVPDIEPMAPAIRAVFGQYKRHDPRFIPYDIADMSAKSDSAVIGALHWLLRLPAQRCTMSELVDLLEVTAVAKRFGIDQDALPRLTQWMNGAGIRWGLNEPHRAELGLGACGDQNSAWFGLQRMLLGYAAGWDSFDSPLESFETIEPYAEVSGLEAELAGSFAQMLQTLVSWWKDASEPAVPSVWAQRCRKLLVAMFRCESDLDKQAMSALEEGLVTWQEACENAGFIEQVPLMVVRTAWIEAVETPSLNQRFRAGGVTFCTLMPMRAIPFEVVCLLGMNDGDYPRRGTRSDFDLMGLPGNARPGDRSRKDDDRQLMLEALLSARQVFYVSWCGHSVRDNSEQPPSVLVSQLRDYLSNGWGREVVISRTTQHPLQPFSRAYFEKDSPLVTYAREWRGAHGSAAGVEDEDDTLTSVESLAAFSPEPNVALTLEQLTQFLRNPVKSFFRQRLQVVFDEAHQDDVDDDESFGIDGLQQYKLLKDLVTTSMAQPTEVQGQLCVTRSLAKLRKSGVLPLKVFGDFEYQRLQEALSTMLAAWHTQQARFPQTFERQSIRLEEGAVVLEDWIDNLRRGEPMPDLSECDQAPVEVAWLEIQTSNLLQKVGKGFMAQPAKLLGAWVRALAIGACGIKASGILIGRDGVVELPPIPQEIAVETLKRLIQLWLDGMNAPLPLPPKTALEFVAQKKAQTKYEGGFMTTGEVEETCLARMFPDFDSLTEDGRFANLAQSVYCPLSDWATNEVKVTVHPNAEVFEEEAA